MSKCKIKSGLLQKLNYVFNGKIILGEEGGTQKHKAKRQVPASHGGLLIFGTE